MILSDPRLFEIARVPRPNPEANVLKTDTAADCPRVPEDGLTINQRTLRWYDSLRPQDYFHCWLGDQGVVNSPRIDRNARIERRLRDRVAYRAERFWDDDRRLAAEVLGERLEKEPAATVIRLRQTPQGCDWLIARWAALARIADRDGGWDVDQEALAFGLLGVCPEERSGTPGQSIDLDGKLIGTPIARAELARQQVAGLLGRKQEVAGLDDLDRAMAQADYEVEPTPELRQLRRQDAELHRRLKWCLDRINTKSHHPRTNPGIYDYYKPNSDFEEAAKPETPASTAPAPAPESQAPTEPAPEPSADPEVVAAPEAVADPETWPSILSAHRVAKERKAEARRGARRDRRERLRG